MTMIRNGVSALALAVAAHAPAAAKTDYKGQWMIASAQPAPWTQSPVSDEDRLVGQSVFFARDTITAPQPLDCKGPRYKLRSTVPEGLFQGNLTAPAEQAAKLGLKGRKIRTLQTGCEGFIDFHFVDGATAMFALNNMIYTIRRP